MWHVVCEECGGYTPNPGQDREDFLREKFEQYPFLLEMMKEHGISTSKSGRLIVGILFGWVTSCVKCGKEFSNIEIPFEKYVALGLALVTKPECFQLLSSNDKHYYQNDRFMLPEAVCLYGYRGQPPLWLGQVE